MEDNNKLTEEEREEVKKAFREVAAMYNHLPINKPERLPNAKENFNFVWEKMRSSQ